MKLTITENGIKKLIPENGMFLTDGETIADSEVWLGKLDNPSNWHEITESQKNQILEQQTRDLQSQQEPMISEDISNPA